MKNVRYECYSDLFMRVLQVIYPTLKEAREWKRGYEKWSEVWIECVEIKKDGTEIRKKIR